MNVKSRNFKRHLEKVHPRYVSPARKLISSTGKCPICGGASGITDTISNIPICQKHYLKNTRHFLIKDIYLHLKEQNNKEIRANPKASYWMINAQLNAMNSLLGWEPEKTSSEQFLAFSETSAFTGYLLIRVVESLPQIKEVMYSLIESKDIRKMPKKLELQVARLIILLNLEFDFLNAAKFTFSGYCRIATDNESPPKSVVLVPDLSEQSIKNLLLFLLKDANEEWHGTFRKFLVPYGTSTAHDEFGTTFHFNRSSIKENFRIFRETWDDVFNTNTRMNASDFEKLWNWLEWVVTTWGITKINWDEATYFDDFKGFGLEESLVFEVLDEILPDVGEKLDLISPKELSKSDPKLLIYFKLADLARGFRILSSKGTAYYLPCRQWFYNKIMPVFIRFARKLKLAGKSFEEDIELFSTLYSKAGIKTGGKSSFGVMIEPSFKKKLQLPIKTSRAIPWKILGKKLPITLEEDNVTNTIGKSGEIDLIVYANMNLYLLELKAINLNSRHAIKYMREKAPIQCAKYAKWVRDKNQFRKFIQEHKISPHHLNSVRIIICSSGVFQDLWVGCPETGEQFAIVPEYILFSTMAGRFTLSLKAPFPPRVDLIAPGIKILDEKVTNVARLDLEKELGEGISKLLLYWTRLTTLDRRQNFVQPKVDLTTAKALNFLGPMYVMNEEYIGETTSWVLPKPLFLKKEANYKFFIGTQLGGVGTTIICETCRSAIKYYWPREESEDARRIQSIFKANSCPLCREKIEASEQIKKAHILMGKIILEFKHNIEKQYE